MEHNLWIITLFDSVAFIGNKDLNGYLPYGHYNDIIVIADHVIHIFLLTHWSLEKWPFYINLKPIFKDSSTRFAFTTLTCDLDGVWKMKVSVAAGNVLVQSWSRFTSPWWGTWSQYVPDIDRQEYICISLLVRYTFKELITLIHIHHCVCIRYVWKRKIRFCFKAA